MAGPRITTQEEDVRSAEEQRRWLDAATARKPRPSRGRWSGGGDPTIAGRRETYRAEQAERLSRLGPDAAESARGVHEKWNSAIGYARGLTPDRTRHYTEKLVGAAQDTYRSEFPEDRYYGETLLEAEEGIQPFLEGAPTEGGLGGDEPDEEEDFWDSVSAGLDIPRQGESEARQQSIPGQAPQSTEGPTPEERADRTRSKLEARENLNDDELNAYIRYGQENPTQNVDWRMFGRGRLGQGIEPSSQLWSGEAAPPDIGPTAAMAAAALSGPAAIMALARRGGTVPAIPVAAAPRQAARTAGREGIAGAERTAVREAIRPGGGQDPNVLPFKMTRDAARRLDRMP